MTTLQDTIRQAAQLAYTENEKHIVGRIDGAWTVASCHDQDRLRQMASPVFTIRATGIRPTYTLHATRLEVGNPMASIEAAIDGDSGWEYETMTYAIYGETVTVNKAIIGFAISPE